jgi:hypothetical protein
MNIFNSVEIMIRSIEQDKNDEKSFVKKEVKYQLVNNNENSNEKIKQITKNLSEIKDLIITEKQESIDLVDFVDDIFSF